MAKKMKNTKIRGLMRMDMDVAFSSEEGCRKSDTQVVLHPYQIKSLDEIKIGETYQPIHISKDGVMKETLYRFTVKRIENDDHHAPAIHDGKQSFGWWPETFGIEPSPFSNKYIIGTILMRAEDWDNMKNKSTK